MHPVNAITLKNLGIAVAACMTVHLLPGGNLNVAGVVPIAVVAMWSVGRESYAAAWRPHEEVTRAAKK